MTIANTEYRSLFAPITKMYDGPDGFFVEGTLVAEEPDRVGEIWDYESSKKSVLDWSEEAHRTTSGKSAGNLRAMHGNVAAGKLRVEEAGGKVTDFKGGAWKEPAAMGSETLATNGRIHGAMLKIINARLRRS